MSFWLVMLAGGALTFATRLSFIAAEGRVALPASFRAMLPYVPIATLTAIILPELVMPGGTVQLSLANARLVAGCAAVAVAAATRSVLVTIAVGFAVLFVVHR
ncbi:MAG: AzlD domain-containing protein, partial [Anaeromyxobacteraceae bacterium]